jgi:cytochrome c oxidase subunit IV
MSQHVVSVRIYLSIFLALMVLTALTTAVAFVDLGVFNTVVALAIACCKMVLVLLFFMHLKYGENLTKLVIVAAFFWFAILLALTLSDYESRNWITQPHGWQSSGISELSHQPVL